MFTTIDSQPEEWLLNDGNNLHTICFCCFRDSANARKWIHELVPKDQHDCLTKWSGGRTPRVKRKRRLQFIEAINRTYDKIDFSVHCISTTEAEISQFTQGFYLQNFDNITQELDHKNRNCMVFKISEKKKVKLPGLRAGMLIWIYFAIKYMKEVNNLSGFIFSDWFSTDAATGKQKAFGVGMVNFLLQSTKLDLQLSIPHDPGSAEADLLSDWFAGWCNSSKISSVDEEIKAEFDRVLERDPKKIDWVMYACNFEIELDGSPELATKLAAELWDIGFTRYYNDEGKLILARQPPTSPKGNL